MITPTFKLKNGRMKVKKFKRIYLDLEKGEWGVQVGHLDEKGLPIAEGWIPAKNKEDALKKLEEVF